MTDYLLLMRHTGNPMAQLSPEETQQHLQQWGEWMGALAQAGRLKGANPLTNVGAVVGKDVVTDGPYAEAKDVVGGFVLVACESLEHAKQTARGCPVVALGGIVEVRETAPAVGM